MQVELLMPNRI